MRSQKIIGNSQTKRHRGLGNNVLVRRQNDGCNTARQVAEAGNHQQDAQDPRKEARLDDKDAERKEPETPECQCGRSARQR